MSSFDFGFTLVEGFVPKPEPEWHPSSFATNIVLAAKYRDEVKADHNNFVNNMHTENAQLEASHAQQ